MPILERLRAGWNVERFAEFALSKLAFISAPTTVADDIGVDFQCTLFRHLPGPHIQLLPTLPFVVQVKSSTALVDLSTARHHLHNFRTPFFVAVAPPRRWRVELYSGRYLPYLFALHGMPSSLKADLTTSSPGPDTGVRVTRRRPRLCIRVAMPRIARLDPSDSPARLERVRLTLEAECREVGTNQYHSAVGQYVFRFADGRHKRILAGPSSAQSFRDILGDRLTEYCRNLERLSQRRRRLLRQEREAVISAVAAMKAYLPANRSLTRAVAALRALH